MRAIGYVIGLMVAMVALQSCEKDDGELEKAQSWTGSKRTFSEVLGADTLRILAIGNSYTEDGTFLLRGIAEAAEMDMDKVCFYRLTRGSASFFTWTECYDGMDFTDCEYTKVLGNLSTGIAEGKYNGGSVFRGILSEPWDVIIINQVSTHATEYSSWGKHGVAGDLPKLLNIIGKHHPDVAVAVMLVHSYADNYKNNTEQSSYVRWQNIVNAHSQMLRDYCAVKAVIPQGTTVQNLRASSLNTANDLTIDGTHLGRGLCRYAAACAVYETLFAPRTGVGIVGNSFRYACTPDERSKYPDGCVDVTDENAPIAQRAAELACLDWTRVVDPEQ